MKYGIDVSNYDTLTPDGIRKPMNWQVSGLDMALIKSSEGLRPDPSYAMQWAEAKILPRVAWHFFRSNLDAIQQANVCLNTILGDFGDNDYLAVDFETADGMTKAQRLAALFSFLYEAEKRIPLAQLMICTGWGTWSEVGGTVATWAAKYKLWLMQWPNDYWFMGIPNPVFDATRLAALKAKIEAGTTRPIQFAPWNRTPDIWQFTSRADPRAIPGYVGYPAKKVVDYDAIFMDIVAEPHYKVCPTCNGTGKVLA